MRLLYSIIKVVLFLNINLVAAQFAYTDFSKNFDSFNKSANTNEKLEFLYNITKWDYKNNETKIEAFLDSVEKKQDKTEEQKQLLILARGHIYYLLTDYNKSIQFLEQVVKDSLKLPQKTIFPLYTQLYESYMHTSNYGASTYYLKRLEKIKDTIDKDSPIYRDLIYFRLPEESIYYKAGMVNKAIEVLKPKYENELAKGNGNEFFLVSFSNNLGLYYLALQKNDSAVIYFRKSISHFNKLAENNPKKDIYLLALLKGNLGEAYFKTGEYEPAERFLKEDIEVNSVYSPESAAWSSIVLARCLLTQKRVSEAYKYLEMYNTFDFSRDSFMMLKAEYLTTLSWYYSLNRQFEASYNALHEATRIKDSIALAEKGSTFLKSEFAYIISQKNKELQKKEVVMSSLIDKESNHENELSEVRLQYYKILGLSIILLGLLVYVIIMSLKRKKTNEQLSRLNHKIAETNEIIKREVHQKEEDAININTNKEGYIQLILNSLVNGLENEETDHKNYIKKEIERRMGIVMRIHRVLYTESNLKAIEMDNYLNVLNTMNLNDRVKMTVTAGQVVLSLERATGVSLLIYELYRNSFKRLKNDGSELKIVISLMTLKDCIQFIYRDNLVLDENLDSSQLIGGNELFVVNELNKKMKSYFKVQYKKGIYFEMMLNH